MLGHVGERVCGAFALPLAAEDVELVDRIVGRDRGGRGDEEGESEDRTKSHRECSFKLLRVASRYVRRRGLDVSLSGNGGSAWHSWCVSFRSRCPRRNTMK